MAVDNTLSQTIRSFEDLIVWQESQQLAVAVYGLSKKFPKEEIFGITSQLRRAVASISANIAEGFGRSSTKDKKHFYVIAYGSTLETKNFLYLVQKLGYASKSEVEPLLSKCVECQKLINAFKKGLSRA